MAHKEKILSEGEYEVFTVPDNNDVECRGCDIYVDFDETARCEVCGERFCKECLTWINDQQVCPGCKEDISLLENTNHEANDKGAIRHGSDKNSAMLDLPIRTTECEQIKSIS